MTRSYKKTPWNLRGSMTDYQTPVLFPIGGKMVDFTPTEKDTQRLFKRNIYTNHDGNKKHGEFLMVKEGKSGSWICPKHNITRFSGCDWSEKYIPPCNKTNVKYKMVKDSVNELE